MFFALLKCCLQTGVNKRKIKVLGEKLPIHGSQKKMDLEEFLIEQSNQGLWHESMCFLA